jgi:regulator of protease activity HflC (stomatin/prohibitin superfamily)
MRNISSFILVILVGVFALVFVPSIRIVDQSKACAIVSLGNVKGMARTGFQLVTPWVTSLDCFSAQVTMYQTGDNENKKADYWDYPVEIKTSDGQTAFALFNVTYHVDPENVIYIRSDVARNEDTLMERVVANYARSATRNLAVNYTATGLYTSERSKYETNVRETIRIEFARFGVTLDDFTLRDINFSEEFENAIEQQQVEKERIETENFRAQAAVYEAQAAVEKSKGEAASNIERAKGEAEAIRLKASADADALRFIAEALQMNPSLLQYEFIKALHTANWFMIPWEQMQGLLPLPPTTP